MNAEFEKMRREWDNTMSAIDGQIKEAQNAQGHQGGVGSRLRGDFQQNLQAS